MRDNQMRHILTSWARRHLNSKANVNGESLVLDLGKNILFKRVEQKVENGKMNGREGFNAVCRLENMETTGWHSNKRGAKKEAGWKMVKLVMEKWNAGLEVYDMLIDKFKNKEFLIRGVLSAKSQCKSMKFTTMVSFV